uniref:Uncharacterized protein n=1 Tax=Arundo donax TaxID=35708 RepID=A0A0A9FN61_ARUDO
MENKPPSSCISPAAPSMSAGDSSWAVHIANFLASPHGREEMDHGAVSDSSFSSGFSSSFDSLDDDASFITSELMCYDGDEEDESLQDTACSSAAEWRQVQRMQERHSQPKASESAIASDHRLAPKETRNCFRLNLQNHAHKEKKPPSSWNLLLCLNLDSLATCSILVL